MEGLKPAAQQEANCLMVIDLAQHRTWTWTSERPYVPIKGKSLKRKTLSSSLCKLIYNTLFKMDGVIHFATHVAVPRCNKERVVSNHHFQTTTKLD